MDLSMNLLFQRAETPHAWPDLPRSLERILWVNDDATACVTIRIDLAEQMAWPLLLSREALEQDLAQGLLRIETHDPYHWITQPDTAFTPRQLAYRDAAWQCIRPIVERRGGELFTRSATVHAGDAGRADPSALPFDPLRRSVFPSAAHSSGAGQRFSRMLRAGYVNRNPLTPGYWPQLTRTIDALQRRRQLGQIPHLTTTQGFSIVGMSGVGKSTSVRRILSLYDQVILHARYGRKLFTHVQVVWLLL